MNNSTDISLKALGDSLDASSCAALGAQVKVRMRPLLLEESAEHRCAASSGGRSMASVVQSPGAIGECDDPRLSLRLYLRAREVLPDLRAGKQLCGFRTKTQVIDLEFVAAQPRTIRPCFDLAELEPSGRDQVSSLLICLSGAATLQVHGEAAAVDFRAGQLALVPADALLSITPSLGCSCLSFLHAAVDYQA